MKIKDGKEYLLMRINLALHFASEKSTTEIAHTLLYEHDYSIDYEQIININSSMPYG